MIINRIVRYGLLGIFVLPTVALHAQDFRELSSEIAQHILASGRKSVAVTDFTDLEGKPTKLGRYLAEEFSTSLLSSAKGFDVIDRTHLNSLLQEHKLATTGLIDPATVRKLGQIAGVETIVTGTMTPFEEYVHLTVKVIDTETAKVVAAASNDVPKTKTIASLIGASSESSNTSAQNVAARPTGEQPGTAPAMPPMPPPVKMDEMLFSARGCRSTGNAAICTFGITNESNAAHNLVFFWSTFLVDEQGNQYQNPRIRFGTGDLIPGVPMVLTVEASNVPSSAKIMNASLAYQIDFGRSRGTVMIKNIPISQR